MANLAQTQATQSAQAADLLKSMTITSSGATMNLSLSLPEAQMEHLGTQSQRRPARKM